MSIESWANATRGDSSLFKNTEGETIPHLKFEVVSARTVDTIHQRKYVVIITRFILIECVLSNNFDTLIFLIQLINYFFFFNSRLIQ